MSEWLSSLDKLKNFENFIKFVSPFLPKSWRQKIKQVFENLIEKRVHISFGTIFLIFILATWAFFRIQNKIVRGDPGIETTPKLIVPIEKTGNNQEYNQLLTLKDKKEMWNLSGFKLEKDGYYCPNNLSRIRSLYQVMWLKTPYVFENLNFEAKLRWRKDERAIKLDDHNNKVLLLIKINDIVQTEFHIPPEVGEVVNFKARNLQTSKMTEFDGEELDNPIATGSAFTMKTETKFTEDNKVLLTNTVTYISNKGADNNDPFHYLIPFDDLDIGKSEIEVGLGVFIGGCISIEGYK